MKYRSNRWRDADEWCQSWFGNDGKAWPAFAVVVILLIGLTAILT